ncbi:IS3 family transposase [Microbulbifer sp. SSSA003]|uniref:IS3 family transposase n=1 Tax=Microbulbifer sp. SSSA003 TaxID=3243377 RepID=UPI00403A2D15
MFPDTETESIKGFYFESVKELRANLSWCLDKCYNLKRRHSSIGFKTPVEYERIAA